MTVPRGGISRSLRFQVLRRDGNACRYCGAMAPDVKLTVDHVIPVALGGTDEPDNLVTACVDCNAGKAATPADAAVVADVAEHAERWARAMQLAAEAEYAVDNAVNETLDKWRANWDRYRNSQGETVPLDVNWRTSLKQLLAAGLIIDDLHACIVLAMEKDGVLLENRFRYFCGVAWNKLRKRQERARRLMESGEI